VNVGNVFTLGITQQYDNGDDSLRSEEGICICATIPALRLRGRAFLTTAFKPDSRRSARVQTDWSVGAQSSSDVWTHQSHRFMQYGKWVGYRKPQ